MDKKRLTIEEVIAHCGRRMERAESFFSTEALETMPLEGAAVKEYWEHRQVKEWLEELIELKGNSAEKDAGSELKCPFCAGEVRIVVCDDEGNIKEDGEEYEKNPWSGLGYKLYHDETMAKGLCPIAGFEYEGELGGRLIYDTREDAIAALNRRAFDEFEMP